MPPDPLSRLDAVARELPFSVFDVDAANAAFARWRESGAHEHQRDPDLWAYCFIQRYFLIRFLRERGAASDLDACVSRALSRVRRRYTEIDPDHFASYVAVACRHTLLNHRRDRQTVTELPETLTDDAPVAHAADLERELVRGVIEASLRRLPDNVEQVGYFRLLDGMEYPDIADRLGLPLPTVRTYASRAMAALREDPRIQALYFEDVLPPGTLSNGSDSVREDDQK